MYSVLVLVQPLHKELYNIHPSSFFIPSFINAISNNTVESFRNIMSEPSPGVYTFAMLQPRFCEMLLDEVCQLFFVFWVEVDQNYIAYFLSDGYSCTILILLLSPWSFHLST